MLFKIPEKKIMVPIESSLKMCTDVIPLAKFIIIANEYGEQLNHSGLVALYVKTAQALSTVNPFRRFWLTEREKMSYAAGVLRTHIGLNEYVQIIGENGIWFIKLKI